MSYTPPSALISSSFAGVSCVLITVLFVGSLYLFPLAKPPQDARSRPESTSAAWPQQQQRDRGRRSLDRDHPLVIAQRIKGLSLTMTLVPIYLWIVFSYAGVLPEDSPLMIRLTRFLQLLGLKIPSNPLKLLSHVALPLLLVTVLFLGPLLMMFLSKELPFQSRFQWAAQWYHLRSWIGIRNYIVGPVSEEFVFRACMVAIAACSGATMRGMVFGLPLVFGIAHLHHGYESYVKNNRTRQALMQSALVSLAQLAYTTLFGWFATFLFLRTSCLLGPCLSHALCNMLGFPDVSSIRYYGPRWEKWIYASFLLGVVLFGALLGPLTEPWLYSDRDDSAYWQFAAAGP